MTDWAKRTVVELKEELKGRGLATTGRKAELVARLNEDDEQAEAADVQDEAPAAEEQIATDEAEAVPETSQAPDAIDDETSAGPEQTPTQDTFSGTNGIDDERTEGADAGDAQPDQNKEDEPMVETTNGAPPPQPSPVSREMSISKDEPINDAASNEAIEDVSPNPEDRTARMTSESISEAQKRKRRSLSPPPTEEAMSQKKARSGDEELNGGIVPKVRLVEETSREETAGAGEHAMDVDEPARPQIPSESRDRESRLQDEQQQDYPAEEMEIERDVVPSLHPATCALYIKNLMRPLRPDDFQAHIVDLATPRGQPSDDTIISEFFLDQVRTHAFIALKSTAAASRVRTALHETVWPNESNRKALWVDFVPPDKIPQWIDMEESAGRRSGARWEVVYDTDSNGDVEAHLETGVAASSRAGPPPGRQPRDAPADFVPTGPRNHRDNANPPTGPRPVRPGTGPGPRPPPTRPGPMQETRAHPVIEYQTVTEDLATRRLENMRSFYTRDLDRDLGRDINRYSFADGANFVDRGKEIFEGIRPPHRERAVRMERRGGGGGRHPRQGGRSFRPRSDRYLPGDRDRDRDDDRRRDR